VKKTLLKHKSFLFYSIDPILEDQVVAASLNI